ncbi:hypothetical protein Hanom_Chr06g00520051 [Helianthus anomalus]
MRKKKRLRKKSKVKSLLRGREALKKPEVKAREPEAKKTKFTVIPQRLLPPKGRLVVEETARTGPEKANGPEVVRIIGLDQPLNKQKGPEVHTKTSAAQHDAPIHTENVQTATEGSAGDVQAHVTLKDAGAAGGDVGGSGATGQKGGTGRNPRPRSPIGAEDTLSDIYYKTYTEDRANDAHVHVWPLKQKDTFDDFGACRDWLLGTFPPGEINRQRTRGNEL